MKTARSATIFLPSIFLPNSMPITLEAPFPRPSRQAVCDVSHAGVEIKLP